MLILVLTGFNLVLGTEGNALLSLKIGSVAFSKHFKVLLPSRNRFGSIFLQQSLKEARYCIVEQ